MITDKIIPICNRYYDGDGTLSKWSDLKITSDMIKEADIGDEFTPEHLDGKNKFKKDTLKILSKTPDGVIVIQITTVDEKGYIVFEVELDYGGHLL